MFFLADACSTSNVLKIVFFIKELFKVAFIIIPIGLIIMLSFDFLKSIAADKDALNKNIIISIKRLFFSVILFFVPTIVSISFGLLDDIGIKVSYSECFSNATISNIKKLEAIEKANKSEVIYSPNAFDDPKNNRKVVSGKDSKGDTSDDSDDSGDDISVVPGKGAESILNAAKSKYDKMDKDGDWEWGRGGEKKHQITCCKFVTSALKAAGYHKGGKILCHMGSSSKPYGSSNLKNMKIITKQKINALKPGDVVIYIKGGGSGNIAIFSHELNGKYYFYGASSNSEVRAKSHPSAKMSGYWKKHSGKLIIVRANS